MGSSGRPILSRKLFAKSSSEIAMLIVLAIVTSGGEQASFEHPSLILWCHACPVLVFKIVLPVFNTYYIVNNA